MKMQWETLKQFWLWMLEVPWRHSGEDATRPEHLAVWLIGWIWAIGGLVLGAFVAPYFVQLMSLSNSPYHDALDIGIAVLAGFLVQFVGWSVLLLAGWVERVLNPGPANNFESSIGIVLFLMPIAAVGYALYRFFTWIGPGQGHITIAFVVGFLIKAFLIPLIKTIASGIGLLWLKTFLRGKKAST